MSASGRWLLCGGVLALVVVGSTSPALAQGGQRFVVGTGPRYDRVRASGFFWRGNVGGPIDLADFDGIPGLEDGVDVGETLGLRDAERGWLVEVNAAAARRHRFIFVISRIEHEAQERIVLPLSELGPLPDLVINATTNLSLRELHGFYNFLFVARPQIELGVLGGLGYFDATAVISSPVGVVDGDFSTPFPLFGGNVMINPRGPVRGYIELSGFPKVTVNEVSGRQHEFVARVEFFVVANVGVIAGYRRYRLDFDEPGTRIDLTWDGFTFGGQVRF